MKKTKKMEDMSREEILAEFDAPAYFMPRRSKKEGLLSLRVPSQLKIMLCEEAKRRGLNGHTTMARILIEEGLHRGRGEAIRRSGKKSVAGIARRLRRDVDDAVAVMRSVGR